MARTYKRDSRGRFASGGGSGGSGGKKASGSKRGAPKTTSARGRALTNQRRATEAVRAGRGGSGPSKKAVQSAVTAMRARAYYAATGTGTKRSAKRAVSAAKKGKAIRAESRAKRKAAGEMAAGRPKARVVARKVKAVSRLGFTQSDFARRSQRTAGIRNPEVRKRAQSLYGKILNLDSTPKQLRSMFKKAGKPRSGKKSASRRQSEREHRDMLALANRLYR